jgi:hypothetical protein
MWRVGCHSHLPITTAANMPTNCAEMKAGAPPAPIPANVSERERAIVTAGLAKEVEAVNQDVDVEGDRIRTADDVRDKHPNIISSSPKV